VTGHPKPPPLPQEHTDWYRRNWKWFIPVACVTAIVLTAVSFVCFAALLCTSMKSIGAYKLALAEARANPRVTLHTGLPLKEGWLVGGSFNVNGASGNAELAIPVSGPRGKGTIYLVASESAGEWRFSTLVFQIDGSGERINIQAK
jgi:hypothetical protein